MKYYPWYSFDGQALRGCEIPAIGDGGMAWLCGGHPSILEQAPAINAGPGFRLTLNHTLKLIRANMALFLDPPDYYDQALLGDARFLRVSRMNYVDTPVDGKPFCAHPNTMFISDVGKEPPVLSSVEPVDWLNDGPLIWFKNSFMLAIQLLYRLGFREIRLAGCAFADAGSYAYGARPELKAKNTELYAKQVDWLRHNQPYFEGSGLRLINITPNNATPFLGMQAAEEWSGP